MISGRVNRIITNFFATFHTCDAMGANFINSILETLGKRFAGLIRKSQKMQGRNGDIQIIMCILSNYTPDCVTRAFVSCPVEEMNSQAHGMDADSFARKFAMAVRLASVDIHRAATHNKGIFNGIDAVVSATGNDFRAVEANGHVYAMRDGKYKGLSTCSLKDGIFHFILEIPLSLGIVGGLTKLHPMVEFSLNLLGHPTALKLREITAAIGLLQNFAAIRSLVTHGIQKGHMKMHLLNILNHLESNEEEKEKIMKIFSNRVVSFNAVRAEIEKIRTLH